MASAATRPVTNPKLGDTTAAGPTACHVAVEDGWERGWAAFICRLGRTTSVMLPGCLPVCPGPAPPGKKSLRLRHPSGEQKPPAFSRRSRNPGLAPVPWPPCRQTQPLLPHSGTGVRRQIARNSSSSHAPGIRLRPPLSITFRGGYEQNPKDDSVRNKQLLWVEMVLYYGTPLPAEM